MAAFSLICRLTDGLPLCQSTDPALLASSPALAETLSKQARGIVATLSGAAAKGEARATVEAGGHAFCYYTSVDDNLIIIVGVAVWSPSTRDAQRILSGKHRDLESN